MPIIAPSLLAADFLHLQRECTMLNESEADWFHLDVMDGRFVPNISYGLPVIEQITKNYQQDLRCTSYDTGAGKIYRSI